MKEILEKSGTFMSGNPMNSSCTCDEDKVWCLLGIQALAGVDEQPTSCLKMRNK